MSSPTADNHPLQIATDIPHAQNQLGSQIRLMRLSAGLTQEELADGICSRAYLAQIEAGKRFPTAAMLSKFAVRLNTSLATFLPAFLSSPMAGIRQCLMMARELSVGGASAAAEDAFEVALKQFEREGKPPRLRPKMKEVRGLIAYRQGNLEAAASLLEDALAAQKEISGPPAESVKLRLSLGIILLRSGDRLSARAVLMHAMMEAFALVGEGPLETEDGPENSTRILMKTIETFVHLALEMRQPRVVLFVLDMAKQHFAARGTSITMSPTLVLYRGVAEVAAKEFDDARRTFENLLQVSDDSQILAYAHANMGVLGRLAKNWFRAQHHQMIAWQMYEKQRVGDPHAIANELAHCALHQGLMEQAEEWLNRAQPFMEDGHPANRAVTAMLQTKLAREAGDLAAARKALAAVFESGEQAPTLEQVARLEAIRLALAEKDEDTITELLDDIEKRLPMWDL